jgi:hypothetical protein
LGFSPLESETYGPFSRAVSTCPKYKKTFESPEDPHPKAKTAVLSRQWDLIGRLGKYMHPIFSECPVCSGEMLATQLECRHCDTKIVGRFYTGPFAGLTLEQLDFIEMFVRNEGKITRLQDELDLSYPTIRNRLHEVIRALGYEPGGDEPGLPNEDERRQILEHLEKGEIDYEEAMRLLKESEAE